MGWELAFQQLLKLISYERDLSLPDRVYYSELVKLKPFLTILFELLTTSCFHIAVNSLRIAIYINLKIKLMKHYLITSVCPIGLSSITM